MRVCTLALSVIAHLLVLALVVVIPLFATDALPEPHRAIEFVEVMPVSFRRLRRSCDPRTVPARHGSLERGAAGGTTGRRAGARARDHGAFRRSPVAR